MWEMQREKRVRETFKKKKGAKWKKEESKAECCCGKYAMSAKGIRGPVMKVLLSKRCYMSLRAYTTLVTDTKCDSTRRRLKENKSAPEGQHPLLQVVWLWQGDGSTTPRE